MLCKENKGSLRPAGRCHCGISLGRRLLFLCIQTALTQVSSKFPAHLSHLAETSFYVNSQTDPCKPADKQRVLLQRQLANKGSRQRPSLWFVTDTSAHLHLAFRIRSRMPETCLSREKQGGQVDYCQDERGGDHLRSNSSCHLLDTACVPLSVSDVAAELQIPPAEEEVHPDKQRCLARY